MTVAQEHSTAIGPHGPLLIVGNVNEAFIDAEAVQQADCLVCNSLLEAVTSAAEGKYVGIGIRLGDAGSGLRSALGALHECSDAKIVLLARIHEEPEARQLVEPADPAERLADEYLLCPVSFSEFAACFSSTPDQKQSRSPSPHPQRQNQDQQDQALQKRIELLEQLATEDDLTGLKNRRYIWEFLRQIILRAKKVGGRVTLLVFDIDDFKRYNDLFGHRAGDMVLKQAAVLMKRCCRKYDVVGRIGGDEFAVVFWDEPGGVQQLRDGERRTASSDHPQEALAIARRLAKELEKTKLEPLGPEGKGLLTISGGLASFPKDGTTVAELFQQADKALLEAKRGGKNRIYLVGRPEGDVSDSK